MGYIKETVDDVALIRFYHKTDDIFNEASEITAFKASGVRTAEGHPDFNRLQITSDEKIHLKKYIHKGVLEVYGIMFKMLGESAIYTCEEITVTTDDEPPTEETFEASGGYIVDNTSIGNVTYREINLSLLDSKIFDCLVDYVLQRWYWLKNMPDDSAMHMQRFNKLLVEINDLTLSLRKPKL